MKNINLFFCLFSVLLLFSCNTEEDQINLSNDIELQSRVIPVWENGVIVDEYKVSDMREATSDEYLMLYQKGWLSYDRSYDCQWSDGVGDIVECSTIDCRVVFHTNPNGSISIGIGCYNAEGEIEAAGSWRLA